MNRVASAIRCTSARVFSVSLLNSRQFYTSFQLSVYRNFSSSPPSIHDIDVPEAEYPNIDEIYEPEIPHDAPNGIYIRPGAVNFLIPKDHIETAFSRSSGPGGQNVNKVNSKAEIRFNLSKAKWLAPEVKEQIRKIYASRVNSEDEFIITSEHTRHQSKNLDDCFKKLYIFVEKAARNAIPVVKIDRSALSEFAKSRRREEKRRRAELKESRRGPKYSSFDFL